jgi:hypothetical protein
MNISMSVPMMLAAITSTAMAGVTYDAQNRYVRAEAFTATGNPSDQITSPDFTTFDASIDRTFGTINAYATQTSQLTADSISMAGTAFGSFGSGGDVAGIGHSYFEVHFTLSEATDFTLNFTADGNAGSYDLDLGAYSAAGSFNTFSIYTPSGTLEAGSYSIILDFRRDPFEHDGMFEVEGDISFDLTFVPAPSATAMLAIGALTLTRRRRP